jgi:hypothetical protein
MATHTITVSNTMTVIAMGDPTLWGTGVWGTDVWGSGNDVRWKFFKNLDTETITQADSLSYFMTFFRTLDMGTMVGAITMSTLCHFDGFGDFKYVRAGDSGDDNFSKTADGSSGWSKTSDGSDDWGNI